MPSVFKRLAAPGALCALLALLGVVAVSPVASGDVLYKILPDPNDSTTSSSTTVMYDPSLVAITVASELTGTSATELNSLQTLNAAATTGITGNRFQNTDRDAAQTSNTLLTDIGSGGYFQFGITGTAPFDVTSLTFDAKKATGSTSTRGYSVQVSIDGGAYTALGGANLTADRNSGFENIALPTTGTTGITSVNFRISSTGGGVEYTNLTINGTVPEPASMAGLAVGALALVMRRARR